MVTSLGKCLETFVSGVMIPYLFSLRTSLRICSSSKTFSGCCVARFSFSLLVPYYIAVAFQITGFYFGPPIHEWHSAAGLDIFPVFGPNGQCMVEACSITHGRSVLSFPSNVFIRFWLSGTLPLGRRAPTSEAKEAAQSICEISASETSGCLMVLGQRTMTGTRVPPSKALYFPPRRLPLGLCPFSNFSAWSS